MDLINLSISRIITHQVFQRDSDGNKVAPYQSHNLTLFDAPAMETFKSRVIEALGHGSKAVPMEIVDQGAGDLATLVGVIVDKNEEDFILSSFDIAKKLTDSQHTRNIPGGILVVFTGTFGVPQRKLFGIIKADINSGYQKHINEETGEISLHYIEELLLTPGTKLYKTAAFFEKAIGQQDGNVYEDGDLNAKWGVVISDYQIGRVPGKAAANYFYSDFLGFGYPETSARVTMRFYEASKTFIRNLDVPDEKKADYYGALNTYLKVNVDDAISPSEFAGQYLEHDFRDEYVNHLGEAGVEDQAFTKDTELIAKQLQQRKVRFRSKVSISAPSDVFEKMVAMRVIDGDPDENGHVQAWTEVIVKDRILDQE